MRNRLSIWSTLIVLILSMTTAGCFTQRFVVGEGSQTGETVKSRQWYVLFGLVPINQTDADQLADGAANYTIETKFTALDVIIGIFTSAASVYPRTVKVTK